MALEDFLACTNCTKGLAWEARYDLTICLIFDLKNKKQKK